MTSYDAGDIAIGQLIAEAHRWIHRRVQTINFEGSDTIRRDVSIDLTLPWLVVETSETDAQSRAVPKVRDFHENEQRSELVVGQPQLDSSTGAAIELPFLPLGLFRKVEPDRNFREAHDLDSGVLQNFDLRGPGGEALSLTDSKLSMQVGQSILSACASAPGEELPRGLSRVVEFIVAGPASAVADLKADLSGGSLVANEIVGRPWFTQMTANLGYDERIKLAAELLGEGPGSYEELNSWPWFRAWSTRFESLMVSGVASGMHLRSGDRLVIKYSFHEKISYATPTALGRLRAGLLPLGSPRWSYHPPLTLRTPDAQQCESFHVEIEPAKGMSVHCAEFSVVDSVFKMPDERWRFDACLRDTIPQVEAEASTPPPAHGEYVGAVLADGPSHSLTHLYLNRGCLAPLRFIAERGQRIALEKDGDHRKAGRRVHVMTPNGIAKPSSSDAGITPTSVELGVRVDLRPRIGEVLVIGFLGCLAIALLQLGLAIDRAWEFPRGEAGTLTATLILGLTVLLTGTYTRDDENTATMHSLLSARIWLGIAFGSAIVSASLLVFGPSEAGKSDSVWHNLDTGPVLDWMHFGPSSGALAWTLLAVASGLATIRLGIALFAALRPPAGTTFTVLRPTTEQGPSQAQPTARKFVDLSGS